MKPALTCVQMFAVKMFGCFHEAVVKAAVLTTVHVLKTPKLEFGISSKQDVALTCWAPRGCDQTHVYDVHPAI